LNAREAARALRAYIFRTKPYTTAAFRDHAATCANLKSHA
jgi:hypothetical protein